MSVFRTARHIELISHSYSRPRARGVPPHTLQEHARGGRRPFRCVRDQTSVIDRNEPGPTGMKLTKAYAYLGDVVEHKQVIPFRRFSGGVGRASQAKQFKTTQGAFHGRTLTGGVIYHRYHRSLAREIRQVHHPTLEECRGQCRREKSGTRRSCHQKHRGSAGTRMFIVFLLFVLSLNTAEPENPSSHIPRTWSNQPVPRSPLPCRNHLVGIGRGSRAEQGQGCGHGFFSLITEPTPGCKETDRGSPYHCMMEASL